METRLIQVTQGTHAVSGQPDAVMVTILGSCVSVCLHDPVLQIGGMNHIVLPGESTDGNHTYGVQLMELLINDLMRRGSSKRGLVAKLFGGSRLIGSSTEVGRRNAQFACAFLAEEGIPLIARSIGGQRGRRVQFRPHDGAARQKLLQASDVPPPSAPKPSAGSIELF